MYKEIIIFIFIILITGCSNISIEEQTWIDNQKENMSISCNWLDMGDYIKSDINDIFSCQALESLVNDVCEKNYVCEKVEEDCICNDDDSKKKNGK